MKKYFIMSAIALFFCQLIIYKEAKALPVCNFDPTVEDCCSGLSACSGQMGPTDTMFCNGATVPIGNTCPY